MSPKIHGFLKYRAVADQLRERIANGLYPAGSLLPGQRELVESLDVSRPSIKSALVLLEKEGILKTVPSVGTLVKRAWPTKAVVGFMPHTIQDMFQVELVRQIERAARKYNAGFVLASNDVVVSSRELGITHLVKSSPMWFLEDRAKDAGIPAVYIGYQLEGVSSVSVDYESGMNRLVAHLKELGHRRIGYATYICQPEHERRFPWFEKAIQQHGLELRPEDIFRFDECDLAKRSDLARQLFKRESRPTALACYHDTLAFDIIRCARFVGFDVPRCLSVAGFDDIPFAGLLQVPLTTVRFSAEDAAVRALQILFRSQANEVISDVLEAPLIIRQSTVAPPAA